MILTIDVGNTKTELGVFEGENLEKHWNISTNNDRTADEYIILLKNLFECDNMDINEVSAIAISSVVPPVLGAMKKAAVRFLDIEPLIVGPGVKTGINIKMDNPREVGADRIVNTVAAFKKFGGQPLIVVDFGTATIIDAISGQGDYLGGAVAPGVDISVEALFRNAAKLPRIELEKPQHVIGKNTEEAMQSGIIYGFVGQVEGLIKRFKEEIGEEAYVIATGGLVDLISPETELINKTEPYLTLEGLRHILELNEVAKKKNEDEAESK